MKHPQISLQRALLFILCLYTYSISAQANLTMVGHLPLSNTASNLTGYVDSIGREYALVGTGLGLAVVDIDTPSNPRQLFMVPGAIGRDGFWREVREYKGYAYVTTEQASGLVVVNLHYLPDSVQYHTINPAGMTTSHTIFIDSNGIAYVNGTDEDLLMLDLNANPYNPPLLGKFSNNYVHDCFVRNDTMWAACIEDGILKVVDVRNKAATNAPVNNITSWATPLNFTHNCWLSDDSKYLFTTDEKPSSTLTCYDVSDLNNVTETDRAMIDRDSTVVIHNTYFLNDYCITAYYTYGVTIHDVTRKNNLVQVGHFDTSPTFAGDGFHGAWGVWPYLPSGNIIVSDIETGLWIFRPEYKRACYLEGVISDSACGTLLNDVKIEIVGTSVKDYSHTFGKYSTGTPDSGTYTIRFSKNGYQNKDYPNTTLQNGVLTTINVELVPIATSQLVVMTVDASNGSVLPDVVVTIQDTSGTTYRDLTTDANGSYTFCDFVQGAYNIYAGKWGWKTVKLSKTISSATDTVVLSIGKGYYDDFVLDYGWTSTTTASSGDWQRGEPDGTTYMGAVSNPDDDHPTDLGADCYVTGNNGGAAGDDDVDNGSTTLRSPIFDLSNYVDPYLSYYRWFFNDGGNGGAPNDSMRIFITNGSDSVLLDKATADSLQSEWVYRNFQVNEFIVPTATMRIELVAVDVNPGHLVEAALDVFQIVDSGEIPSAIIPADNNSFRIYPNPFRNLLMVERHSAAAASLCITDITGRKVKEQTLHDTRTTISVSDLSKGLYIVRLLDTNGRSTGERKMVKVE